MQLLPGVRHGWLVQLIDDGTLEAAAEAGVHGLYPRANAVTAAAVAAALADGFSVRAWGVKNVEVSSRGCHLWCRGNSAFGLICTADGIVNLSSCGLLSAAAAACARVRRPRGNRRLA